MTLLIEDLSQPAELDARAGRAVRGGALTSTQGIGNGGVTGLGFAQGGGVLSPTINVQTIVNTPVNVQLTTLLNQIQTFDYKTIIASAQVRA